VVKDSSVVPARVLGWGSVIAGCIFAISFLDRVAYPHVFAACIVLAGIAYLRTLGLLGKVAERNLRALALCLVLAALWRIPLLLMPPTLSTDVYRYVWDGRVQQLGYSPYLLVPSSVALRHLHTAETLRMNFPDLPTPYPPAAELFFRAVTTFDESARALKSAILLCDAAIVAVILWWLAASQRSPWWVLAYAWNPLVALEGAGNGHVDVLGALCLVVTAASLKRGRRTVAAVAFALAVGVKFVPATLAPLLWRRIRLRDAALSVATFAAFYIPFLRQGGLPLGSLGVYLANWRVNAPVYSALERIVPTPGLIAVPAVGGFAVALWARWHLALDSPEAWAWPIATTLLLAPTIFPWYLIWVTPFLFTPQSTLPLAVWTVSSLTLYWWLPVWAKTVVEYLAVLGAAGWMLAQSLEARRAASSAG
jgi:alpha-1,6-mannosyltransferase